MSAEELPVRLVENEGGEIRRLKFSDDRINKAIDHQLAQVPADARVALVATAYKSPSGAITTEMALFVRVTDEFSFGGFVRGDVKKPLQEVGAELRFVK